MEPIVERAAGVDVGQAFVVVTILMGRAQARPVKVRRGNVHLKTALVEAAAGACRKKNSYLRDKYFRLRARRGPQRAAMAIAHKILIAAYHVLLGKCAYKDLGPTYLDQLNATRTKTNLVRRLERMGCRVQLAMA